MEAEVHVLNLTRAEILLVPENQEEEELLAKLRTLTDTPPYTKGKARIRTLAGTDTNHFVIDL